MNGVQKGQIIKASTINEIVANINSLHGDAFSSGRKTGLPSAFIIRGHLKDKKLTGIDIFNNYYNDDSGSHKLSDKTYTGDQLNGVYGIYIVRERRDKEHPTADQTPRIMTNNELDQIEQARYQIKRLYEVAIDVEAGKFRIIYDCRQAADFSSGNDGSGDEAGACSCDISAYYTEYDEKGNRNNKIATWTNGKEGDAAKKVDIYAPSPAAAAEPQGAFRWGDIEQKEEKKYGQIKYCHFQFGRKCYTATNENWTVPVQACTFYLYVMHGNPGGSMIVTNDYGNTLTSTTIPLFSIDDEGNITNDFRGMPVVPVWSTAQG